MAIRIIESGSPLADPAVMAVRDVLRSGGITGTRAAGADVRSAVEACIADVLARGDQAVIDLTVRIEKVRLTPLTLRVEPAVLAAAHAAAEPAFLALVHRAAANIRDYQRGILHRDGPPLRRGGRELGVRYTPVDRVGVFVPGGSGSGAVLVSTMLMTIVPAQVAGVGEIALVSPPTVNGDVSPMILAVADELGIAEVYRASGTAGLAALAIGTASIRRVQKIVGPGNAFITEAKRQLFGRVGIDSLAGPSEVLIVADDTADAECVAADMLAQAEHDPGSAVLVTPSRELADAVAAAVERQLPKLERAAAIKTALEQFSAILVVPDLAAACGVADDFATEHLQIITADDDACLARIRNAGAIFLGPNTPVPVGDYYAGPSHVLPTGGTARFFSPLSCNEFLKASSILRYDADSLAADAADVIDFATREGLTAHATAVRMRTEKRK
jgi:histidinol dehydrogenase